MSKTGTTRVTVKPGDILARGDTGWARLDAMTDEVVAAALSDPSAQSLTPEQLSKMRRATQRQGTRPRPPGIQLRDAVLRRVPKWP
jgi:putative transcriptional regulator